MLLNNFFSLLSSKNEQQIINATLQINKLHPIFKGHFPGQPVVPGVCMMQIIKEILEKELQKKLILRSADHLKFLTILDPNVHTEVSAELKTERAAEDLKVTATLFSSEIIFFKMKSSFQFAI